MSSKPLMLEGLAPKVDDQSEELRALRRENQRLDETLRTTRNELGQAQADKEKLERSLRALRNQLTPLHRALRAVFGEIELAIGEEEQSSIASSHVACEANPRVNVVWESWKAKLRGKQADFIQALLEHGEMTSIQLRVVTHSGSSTVSETLNKLQTLGLVERNGGKYSLKQL